MHRKIKILDCKVDGDHLCVMESNYVNAHESEAVFIQLTDKQILEISELK